MQQAIRLSHYRDSDRAFAGARGIQRDSVAESSKYVGAGGENVFGGVWTDPLRQQSAPCDGGDEQAHLSRLSTLGTVSATLAHELGQPLSAIGMGAATALRLLGKDQVDLAAVRRLCERIVAQSTRAADIIDRVQGMAAKRDPLTTRLALADLLDEAVRFVRHELDREAIVLRFPTLSSLGLVDVDRVQLQQVLVNLLMNAIQALRRAKTPAPEISIDATRGGDRIRIEIQDNGPGIPAELRERIFEEFFTTRPEGLGLGLRICRSIVHAHDGIIEAQERDDGTGARFVVTLPAAR